jgi:hypothetical protein
VVLGVLASEQRLQLLGATLSAIGTFIGRCHVYLERLDHLLHRQEHDRDGALLVNIPITPLVTSLVIVAI